MPPKLRVKTRFPVSRIKKIMQKDDDVGRVAAVAPALVSKAVEIFMQRLIDQSCEIAREDMSKMLHPGHVKACVERQPKFDFLVSLVEGVPDAPARGDEPSKPRKPRAKPKPRAKKEEGAGGGSTGGENLAVKGEVSKVEPAGGTTAASATGEPAGGGGVKRELESDSDGQGDDGRARVKRFASDGGGVGSASAYADVTAPAAAAIPPTVVPAAVGAQPAVVAVAPVAPAAVAPVVTPAVAPAAAPATAPALSGGGGDDDDDDDYDC